jgi:signal transduction histidine kinase
MKSRILLIGLLLLIVSVIVTLNLVFYQSYQSEMAHQINKHQLIIARTVASSIEDTVEHFKEETGDLASLIGLRGLERDGLDQFFRHAFTELRDNVNTQAAIFDTFGHVVFSTWRDEDITGYGRSFVKDVMAKRPPDILFDYDSVEGGHLNIWAPIRRERALIGALLVSINIDDLNQRFLKPVKSGQRGYAWMMNGAGSLMYHPREPGMVGKNIFTQDEYCFECHTSFKAEKQILASQGLGSSAYVAPGGEDKLVAFSWIEPLRWVVCVTIPYSDVTASLANSMRLHSLLVISILVLTVISAAGIIVVHRGRVKAEAKARYMEKVRQYADELENIVQERTKELLSEKEKLVAIIGSMEAGIGIFDREYRCVWMNQVLRDWLGQEKAGALTLDHVYGGGVAVAETCSVVEKERLVQNVASLDLGSRKGTFQISLSTFHTPDGTTQFLMHLQDITEIRKAEEKLAHSEKLTALARLSAGVAHEIGNPLTSISSYVQILREGEGDEFKLEALDIISRHIRRIVSIVKEMSDFAKTKAVKIDDYDIADLVDSTVDLVKYDRRAKKMEIRVDVPRGLPTVHVDGNQLVQIFMNLVLNASDAMEEGGTLTIRGQQVDGYVELDFHDTGQGIPEDELDRIFDPFFTTKETGTGLGLSVSYGIVKSMGGDIIVESAPNRGTTFKVRVPSHG